MVVVLLDELYDLVDAAAVRKGTVAALDSDQLNLCAVGAGQFVEYPEKQLNGLEPLGSGQAQQSLPDGFGRLFREFEPRGRLAEQVADVPQLVGVENAPRGKLFGKLDHDDLTADVEKGVVAFVAVEYVGSGDDQVFFGEILDQVTQDAFPAHVERQAQFVVLVEMEGKIHLVVGPVVCDEQVVFSQRGDLLQNVLHGLWLT